MRRTVNSLYAAVNPLRQCCLNSLPCAQQVANTTITRRHFAATLQISPSMWSQIKSSRPIGDKLARQIEQHHGKPPGWLDEVRESDSVAPAEQAFLDLALKAWRATNSAGRRALREQLKLLAAARISE